MVRAFAAAGRLLRAVAAFAALIAFVAGVPWLLTASARWPLSWIGWPSLAQVPGVADVSGALTSPWSDQMILALLASVGWVLWLIFVRHVAIEVIEAGASRRGQLRAPATGHGPVRWVAAVLVGAIIGAVLFDAARAVTGTTGTSAAAAAADAAAHRPAVAVAVAPPAAAPMRHTGPRPAITVHADATTTSRPASTSHHTAVPSWARDAPGGIHRVKAGDNLWDIAEHTLGDPHRWREIYTLNRGHEQANGYALTDPDEIHIGWTLALPAHHPRAGVETPPKSQPTEGGHTAPSTSTTTRPKAPSSASPATSPPSATGTPELTTQSPPPSQTPAPGTPTTAQQTPPDHSGAHAEHSGVTLPSQGWISLGLAATIAALAQLLRLHRRRFTRLSSPIPVRTGPTRPPVPAELAVADAAGRSDLEPDLDPESPRDRPRPGARPVTPSVAAPVGVDTTGAEVSLFDLPGPGLSLTGPGAEPAARAVLASTLATGVLDQPATRPIIVTTGNVLARLLPDGVEATGLDPHGVTFDGERLLLLADTGNAVSHAEEEMIARRRILDSFDEDSMSALNARTELAEMQPPYVLLLDAADRYAGRLASVAAHQHALHLYVVVLGAMDGINALTVASDGTTTSTATQVPTERLATLAPTDLAQLLAMISAAAARPEPGTDIDMPDEPGNRDDEPPAVVLDLMPDLPASTSGTAPPVRLSVLGPVTVATDNGLITTGMRSGSYAVLAVLAAHPHGRTLDEIAADVHPNTDPVAAIKRLRTDITTIRRVVRAATGTTDTMFILYDGATTRYRIDPDTIDVDLWRMLTAIGHANTTTNDTDALAALREATDLYSGDFAEGQDHAWVTDYATTPRLQILNIYARIAELLETDQPDAAIASLEQALRHDPLNEEIYQRIMRIQGRLNRADAVRRTIRRLENQLAELGGAEPSEATRRVAARQLRPVTSGARP